MNYERPPLSKEQQEALNKYGDRMISWPRDKQDHKKLSDEEKFEKKR